jgi:choline dehydrogenase-like flavoprotein
MDTINSADYLIVGGGTAGIPLGTRLAERGHSVVIIEAGEDVSAVPEVRIPGQSCIFCAEKTVLHSNLGLFVENLKNPQLNWSFTSTPQKHAEGRIIPLPRYANDYFALLNLMLI